MRCERAWRNIASRQGSALLGITLLLGACRSGESPVGDAGETPDLAHKSDASGGAAGAAPDAPVSVRLPPNTSDPRWEPVEGTVGACELERIANADELVAFRWTPCEGMDGCERAELDPVVFGEDTALRRATGIAHEASETLVGLVTNAGMVAFFTDEMGNLRDAFRARDIVTCIIGGPAASDLRYGFAASDRGVSSIGALFQGVQDPEPPQLLLLEETVPGAPQAVVLGTERVLWTFVLPTRQVSTTYDGTDVRLIAQPGDGVFDMSVAVSTGPRFLFHYRFDDGLERHNPIMITDGLSGPETYLSGPDLFTSGVAFAHSHVAWQRGIDLEPGRNNVFGRAELWAARYDPDPSVLRPEKIGDLDEKSLASSNRAGGWGRYALFTVDQAAQQVVGLQIWTLETKTVQRIQFPRVLERTQIIGLTKSHVWMTAGEPISLMRFALE